jgi:hypothetical protein
VPAVTGSPAAFADRQRFARQHRLVHVAVAIHDNTVDGNAGTGPQEQAVTRHDLVQRHVLRPVPVVVEPWRGIRAQRDQPAMAAPARPRARRLQPAAKQDQRHDDGGSLEIHVPPGLGHEPLTARR